MAQRSFQQRAQYQEGRKVRGSRQARAIGKSKRTAARSRKRPGRTPRSTRCTSSRGRRARAAAARLLPRRAGDGTGDRCEGHPAPRLGEVELSAEAAREFHRFLVRQVVRMLCVGLIHGDLSEYNVLVARDGPVIIDLPQVVSAAGNNAARAMLLRDVNNSPPPSAASRRNCSTPNSAGDVGAVRAGRTASGQRTHRRVRARRNRRRSGRRVVVIEDAREEALQRQLRLAS